VANHAKLAKIPAIPSSRRKEGKPAFNYPVVTEGKKVKREGKWDGCQLCPDVWGDAKKGSFGLEAGDSIGFRKT